MRGVYIAGPHEHSAGNRRLSIYGAAPNPSRGLCRLSSRAANGNFFRISGELLRVVVEDRAALLKVRSLPKGTPVPADVLFTSGGGLTYLPENSGIPVQPHSCRVRNAPGQNPGSRQAEYSVWGGIPGENVSSVMTQYAAQDTLLLFGGI